MVALHTGQHTGRQVRAQVDLQVREELVDPERVAARPHVVQQHRELVLAEPRGGVPLAHCPAQPADDLAAGQGVVVCRLLATRRVTARELEPQQHHRAVVLLGAPRPLDGRAEPLHEQHAVRQARLRVAQGVAPQRQLLLLALGHVDEGADQPRGAARVVEHRDGSAHHPPVVAGRGADAMLELERHARPAELCRDGGGELVPVVGVDALEPLGGRGADVVVLVPEDLLPARRVVDGARADVPVPGAVLRGHRREGVPLLAGADLVGEGALAGGRLLKGSALLAQGAEQPLLVEGDGEQRRPVVVLVPCAGHARLDDPVDRQQAPVAAGEGHRDHERQVAAPDPARAGQGGRGELARGRRGRSPAASVV